MRIDFDITELVLSYDILEIFKLEYMKNYKKKFYELVTDKLKYYYRAYIHTRIMKRDTSLLRVKPETELKSQIRDCFLKNNLPFEHWEMV